MSNIEDTVKKPKTNLTLKGTKLENRMSILLFQPSMVGQTRVGPGPTGCDYRGHPLAPASHVRLSSISGWMGIVRGSHSWNQTYSSITHFAADTSNLFFHSPRTRYTSKGSSWLLLLCWCWVLFRCCYQYNARVGLGRSGGRSESWLISNRSKMDRAEKGTFLLSSTGLYWTQ